MSHEGLLTSVVGSDAHPGWFASGLAAAERGEFGAADLGEMLAPWHDPERLPPTRIKEDPR